MSMALFLLATLQPVSIAPDDAQRKRDICAIFALPERPGFGKGTRKELDQAEALVTDHWFRFDATSIGKDAGCPAPAGFQDILLSPRGRLAKPTGGWQTAPLTGAYGDCYYEKKNGRWRTLTCVITAVS